MQLYINHTTKRMKAKVPQNRQGTRDREEHSFIPYLYWQLADSLSTPFLFLVYKQKDIF